MKKYVTPGIVLILAGLYFLLGALPGVNLPEGTFFVLVGLGLLIGRLTTGKCGFTISGFIVLCLGAGWMAADLLMLPGKYASVVTPLALSLAFFLIHICEFRRIGNWPIIPALILLCVGSGLLILFTPGLNALLKPYYGTIIPALLILVGICLLVRGIAHSHRAPKPQQNAAKASYSYSDTSTWAQPPLHDQPRQEAPAADAAAVPDAPAAETAAAPDAAEAQENTYTAPVDAPEEAVDSTDESQVKED